MFALLILLACRPPTQEELKAGEACLLQTAEQLDLTPRGVVCSGDGRVWIYCKTYPEELQGKPLDISFRTNDSRCFPN